MIIHCYADPGHAWYKVTESDILKYAQGIFAKISPYSYHKPGKAVYLEEDCDITLYLDALKAQGIIPTIRQHVTNNQSKIRNYAPYSLSAIGYQVPAPKSSPKPWLWPDRVIGKRESRELREEHNALVERLLSS